MGNTAAAGSVETVNANVSGRSVEPPTKTPPTEGPPTEETTRFLCGDQRGQIKWSVSSSQRSQVFLDNTVEHSIIYTDMVSETIPEFTLTDSDKESVAKIKALTASPETPVAIFRYNRTHTSGAFDSDFSIPIFIRKKSKITGKVEYEPLTDVYSPEISYNKFDDELILSFWQNIDPSAGVTISSIEGYGNDETKDCSNKVASTGSVSTVENKSGSVSSVYKNKNKDIQRALMHTQGSPVAVAFIDGKGLPYDIVYIFNEPAEVMRKKGPINDINLNVAVTLIADNEDCVNRPDRSSVNNSTWVYDGDHCKYGDLDDLFKVDTWCGSKSTRGSIEITNGTQGRQKRQFVLRSTASNLESEGEYWVETKYVDDPSTPGRKIQVSVRVSAAEVAAAKALEAENSNLIRGGKKFDKINNEGGADSSDSRLFIWINENKNYSPQETIKGGLVFRRSKDVTQKIVGHNITSDLKGFNRFVKGYQNGTQNIGAVIMGDTGFENTGTTNGSVTPTGTPKPSLDEIKCGMFRDVLHIADDDHLEVRTSSHFIYQDRQQGLPAENLSGPVVFFPVERFNLCNEFSGALTGVSTVGGSTTGTFTKKCEPYSGFFFFKKFPFDDKDPTKSNKCKNNMVTNVDGTREWEVPGVWHITTDVPVFNWTFEPPPPHRGVTRVGSFSGGGSAGSSGSSGSSAGGSGGSGGGPAGGAGGAGGAAASFIVPHKFGQVNASIVESYNSRHIGTGDNPTAIDAYEPSPNLDLSDDTNIQYGGDVAGLSVGMVIAISRRLNDPNTSPKAKAKLLALLNDAKEKRPKKPAKIKKSPNGKGVGTDKKLNPSQIANKVALHKMIYDVTPGAAIAMANAANTIRDIQYKFPKGKLPDQEITDYNSDGEITGVRVNSEFGFNQDGEIVEIKSGKINVEDKDFDKTLEEVQENAKSTYLEKLVQFPTGRKHGPGAFEGQPEYEGVNVYVDKDGNYLDKKTLKPVNKNGFSDNDKKPGKPVRAGRIKPIVDAGGNVTFVIVSNERKLGEIVGEKRADGTIVGGIVGEVGVKKAVYEAINGKGTLHESWSTIEGMHHIGYGLDQASFVKGDSANDQFWADAEQTLRDLDAGNATETTATVINSNAAGLITSSNANYPLDPIPSEEEILYSLNKDDGVIKYTDGTPVMAKILLTNWVAPEFSTKTGICRAFSHAFVGSEMNVDYSGAEPSFVYSTGFDAGPLGTGMIITCSAALQGDVPMSVGAGVTPGNTDLTGTITEEEKSVLPEGVLWVGDDIIRESQFGGMFRFFDPSAASLLLTEIDLNMSAIGYKDTSANIENAAKIRKIMQEYLNNAVELFKNMLNFYFRMVVLDWWDNQTIPIGTQELVATTSLAAKWFRDDVEVVPVGVSIIGDIYRKAIIPPSYRQFFNTIDDLRFWIDLTTGKPVNQGFKTELIPQTEMIVFSELPGSSLLGNTDINGKITDMYSNVNRNYSQTKVHNRIGAILVEVGAADMVVKDMHIDHVPVGDGSILPTRIGLEEGFDIINTALKTSISRIAHLEQKPNGVFLATVEEVLSDGKLSCSIDNTDVVFLDVVANDTSDFKEGDKVWIVRAMNDDKYVAYKEPQAESPAEYVSTTGIVPPRVDTPDGTYPVEIVAGDVDNNQQEFNLKILNCLNGLIAAVVAEKQVFSPRFGVVSTVQPNNTANNAVSIEEGSFLGTNRFRATTTRPTLQNVSIVLEVVLPDRFRGWDPTTPMQVLNVSTGVAFIQVRVTDCNGVVDVGAHNLANASLTDSVLGGVGEPTEFTGTYVKNGFVRIDFTFFVVSGDTADLGRVELNYL